MRSFVCLLWYGTEPRASGTAAAEKRTIHAGDLQTFNLKLEEKMIKVDTFVEKKIKLYAHSYLCQEEFKTL